MPHPLAPARPSVVRPHPPRRFGGATRPGPATAGRGAELVAPLLGALKVDHRGLPAVALPGARYLAPSTRRAATGAHYTPRSLATDIADNTLEPLVYRPGPLETARREEWRLRPSTEILALRVADIAMGSGAFLVAACRYLADRLVEAWDAEGRADATRAVRRRAGRSLATDAEVEDVLLNARRLVAEHCLYGVDINPLAVEMAKLSLWLVTMDRERPFGFLDDRLRAGDTLLGLVSVDQLETLHMDPVAGRARATGRLFDGAHQIPRRLAGPPTSADASPPNPSPPSATWSTRPASSPRPTPSPHTSTSSPAPSAPKGSCPPGAGPPTSAPGSRSSPTASSPPRPPATTPTSAGKPKPTCNGPGRPAPSPGCPSTG
ncbi:MAG: hypothetical protein M3063_06275, partial [Actinomycetota bacterium]|nr:hypothetical protein [Actinomycetota bacterium]